MNDAAPLAQGHHGQSPVCDSNSAYSLPRSMATCTKWSMAALLGAAFALSSTVASAASFVISEDIENGGGTGQQYLGPGTFASLIGASPDSFIGASLDGGKDAFDNYGRWEDPGAPGSSLSFTRRVDALTASNTYRFLDIFTNATASPITTSLTFFGDLGSDGDEMIDLSITGLTVAHESRTDGTFDPVIAHVYGNNSFAEAKMSADIVEGKYSSSIVNLSLDPGESVGILQFAYLTRADTTIGNYGTGGTNSVGSFVADATAVGNSLLSNPDLSGLSQVELVSISNFDVIPEPSSALLLSLALVAIGIHRRRN